MDGATQRPILRDVLVKSEMIQGEVCRNRSDGQRLGVILQAIHEHSNFTLNWKHQVSLTMCQGDKNKFLIVALNSHLIMRPNARISQPI